MRKKCIALLLAALLAVGLFGCGQQARPGADSAPSAPQDTSRPLPGRQPGQTPEQAPEQAEEVAVLERVEEGALTDSEGFEYDYCYRLPSIDADTPDARAINEEIAASYGAAMKESLALIRRGELPDYTEIAYDAYRGGGILSLVLRAAYGYGPYGDYSVYLYEPASGRRLQNEDLLQLQGLSEEEALIALRRAAAQLFDDLYADYWHQIEDTRSGAFQQMRSETLSQRYLNLDVPLYIDGGALCAVACICDYMVGDVYHTVTLHPRPAGKTVVENRFDFVDVLCQNGAVSLRFQTIPLREEFLPDPAVELGASYPVQGLYSNYSKAYIALAGPNETPWLFLLTSEGRVEYVDLSVGLATGYFCAGGPLLGLDIGPVVDFTEELDNSGFVTVYGVGGKGQTVDLLALIEAEGSLLPALFVGGWDTPPTGNPAGQANLQLWQGGNGDNARLAYELRQPEDALYGVFRYCGMNEQGLVYAYRLWPNGEGRGVLGAAALERYDTPQEPLLCVTELGGTPLFGARPGDVTELTAGAAG